MATLASLLTDVYSITNRPDLVNESTLAVKAATLKAHQSDYFYRDLIAGSYSLFVDPTAFVQSVATSVLNARYRAFNYLQNFDPLVAAQPATGKVFKIISPNELMDDYKILRQDVAWVAGLQLNLRCSVALPTLYYGMYIQPDLTYAAQSWISDAHPYCIIFEAARTLFKTIGLDAESAAYEKLVAEQYTELKLSNVVAQGY